jgi:MFS family permease
MKKDTIRAVVVAVVALVIYNLISFVIPFAHTAAFWISYGFTLAAFAVVCASIYIAFIKNPDAKSRFYGFPIARIGVLYGCAQLAVSLIVMALAQWTPWWIPMLVYAIGMGAAVIGLVAADAVVEEIQTQDVKLKKDVSLMHGLQSKISQIASQTDDAAIKALAEEFRYSDPVSNDAIADAEADLAAAVDQLQAAFVDGDNEAMTQLCRKATALLAERNRLCKLNKN